MTCSACGFAASNIPDTVGQCPFCKRMLAVTPVPAALAVRGAAMGASALSWADPVVIAPTAPAAKPPRLTLSVLRPAAPKAARVRPARTETVRIKQPRTRPAARTRSRRQTRLSDFFLLDRRTDAIEWLGPLLFLTSDSLCLWRVWGYAHTGGSLPLAGALGALGLFGMLYMGWSRSKARQWKSCRR